MIPERSKPVPVLAVISKLANITRSMLVNVVVKSKKVSAVRIISSLSVPPSMKLPAASLPPIKKLSSPSSPNRESEPPLPVILSTPTPPLITLTPASPRKVSLKSVPMIFSMFVIVSIPCRVFCAAVILKSTTTRAVSAEASSVSIPAPPSIVSFPKSSTIRSSPSPASTSSLPLPELIVSLPKLAVITSCDTVLTLPPLIINPSVCPERSNVIPPAIVEASIVSTPSIKASVAPSAFKFAEVEVRFKTSSPLSKSRIPPPKISASSCAPEIVSSSSPVEPVRKPFSTFVTVGVPSAVTSTVPVIFTRLVSLPPCKLISSRSKACSMV